MNAVKQCFERVRVIRGVNYGIITNEQIENLFELYRLNKEQQRCLLQLMNEHGIRPINESEVPNGLRRENINPTANANPKYDDDNVSLTGDEKGATSDRKSFYDTKLLECINEIKCKPQLAYQYEEESVILCNKISEQSDNGHKPVVKFVTNALIEVGCYRVREKLKTGWICGTYMSRESFRIERLVSHLFIEEELEGLVVSCVKKEKLNIHQQEMVLLLLYCVPYIIVNQAHYLD